LSDRGRRLPDLRLTGDGSVDVVEPAVRVAVAGDLAELIWLEQLAREHLVGQRGADLWLERHAEQSPAWPALDAGDVLVSTIDEVPVGYLRLHVDDGVVYVDDVFVHPTAREIGCGDALLAAAVAHGIAAGASRIEAEALPGDRDTKNLYERAAITAKRITVSAPIGADPSG
jgi:GNAT superfamily N-acetyltransferase